MLGSPETGQERINMEHRCGLRRATRLRVTLRTLRASPVEGEIVSISGSGAVVLSALNVPVNSLVLVQFDSRQGESRLASTTRAEVIRPVQGGFAIEWEQFAPAPVRAALRHVAADTSRRERKAQPHLEGA
jgi:hypothetical protein